MSLHLRPRSPLLGRALLALGATGLGLAAGEGLVRALRSGPELKVLDISSGAYAYQRSTNPLLGFELKPSYRSEDPDYKDRYEQINSHGQRDRERSLAKPPGIRRVILLGDSIVEGHGLHQEDTLSARLEASYPDGKTEVLNFGVSGYCTRAEVELLETKGLEFQPDEVVLLFSENDYENLNWESQRLEGVFTRPAWVKTLFVRSRLFRLAALRLNLFQLQAEFDPLNRNHDAIGGNNVADGLERLAALARSRHFAAIVAIWPRFGDETIEDVHRMPDGRDLVVERICRMYGLPAVRLSESFARDRLRLGGASPRLLYTQLDTMHPSPEGSRTAARILHAVLVDLEAGAYPQPTGAIVPDREAIDIAAQLGGQERPNYARVLNNQARALYAAGQTDRAIELLNTALTEDPDSPQVHGMLGTALFETKRDYAQARLQLERSIQIDPRIAVSHFWLSRVLIAQGDLAGAESHLHEAIRIDPELADAHLSLGMLLQRLGRVGDAVQAYRHVLARDPHSFAALNDLAWLLATSPDSRWRDGAEAVRLADQAAQAAPDGNPSVLDTLAAAYAEAGRFDDAGATAERAAALATAAGQQDLAREIRDRRELYRKRQAYRERPTTPG